MKKASLILLSLCLLSCLKQNRAFEPVGFDTYNLYDVYIDSHGNQGIVILKEQEDDGAQWVIVLSADETDSSWGLPDKYVYPMERYAKDGLTDTKYPQQYSYAIDLNQRVEAQGLSSYPAFAWCHAKNNGETVHAGSWILPSEEMMFKALNDNYLQINKALSAHNMTPISTTGFYWTCTEDINGYISDSSNDHFKYGYDPAARAIPITYNAMYPIQKTVWEKSNIHHVRAVKIIHYYYPVKHQAE